MHENKEVQQRAILVAADTGDFDIEISLAELEELAKSAGAEVLATVSQKRAAIDRATVIGTGRLEEIKTFAESNEANLLIFDHELTASQIRNIGEATGVDVIDRTMLILDIFARRARTKEGRLQVELAQQRYRLPRLGGQGKSLSRLGGGIGTRGPGETKLESDRRHIRRRIQALEAQLTELEKRRAHQHARRKKDGVTAVAIVGYTNVGKSTLLNRLTDAGILAEDMLFATLDPTARALSLPDGRSIMLVDTVGLLRRLPHHLVKAFHSTLEEAIHADLIINICDASNPEAEAQISVTKELLDQLGISETPMLIVLNKCDKLMHQSEIKEDVLRGACFCHPRETPDMHQAEIKEGVLSDACFCCPHETPDMHQVEINGDVLISAKTGWGMDRLLTAIAAALEPSQVKMFLLLPYDQGGLVAEIRKDGKILTEEYTSEGIQIDAWIDRRILHKFTQYRLPRDGSTG